jgi:hypothetical protein
MTRTTAPSRQTYGFTRLPWRSRGRRLPVAPALPMLGGS